MKSKYAGVSHVSFASKKLHYSSTWSRIHKVIPVVERAVHWTIGRGNISFWHDRWFKGVLLSSFAKTTVRDSGLTVREALSSPSLWLESISLPSFIIDEITGYFNALSDVDDLPHWIHSQDGNFLLKTSWNLTRKKEVLSLIQGAVWDHMTPIKWSFFSWRCLRFRVPFDHLLSARGIVIISRCACCVSPSCESLDHVLTTSSLATRVWEYFCRMFKMPRMTAASFREVAALFILQKWYSKAHKSLIIFVFNAITYDLWLLRCNGRFGGRKGHFLQVIYRVSKLVEQRFYGVQLPRCCVQLGDHFQGLIFSSRSDFAQIVRWSPPSHGRYKLNCDGSSFGNPGQSGGGGILRDHGGAFLWAFSDYFGVGTSMVAEAKA
jgi:hypothetical protein